MAKTANIGLPLISPSQAQKHVTVNDALSRLDAFTQLRVLSSTLTTPPGAVEDGASYLVPDMASGEWAGQGGRIAVRSNGGWVFLAPVAGWRAWHVGVVAPLVFDGEAWISNAIALSAHGACTAAEIIEFDHTISPGTSSVIEGAFPRNAQVIGVTGRVIQRIDGASLTGWRIGVPDAGDRFGTGLGLSVGSYLLGLSGTPTTYYADTSLVIAAEEGTFTSGVVRIAVHMTRLSPPREASLQG
jgi:hypothetical protein